MKLLVLIESTVIILMILTKSVSFTMPGPMPKTNNTIQMNGEINLYRSGKNIILQSGNGTNNANINIGGNVYNYSY